MAHIEISTNKKTGTMYARIHVRVKDINGEWKNFYKRVENDKNWQEKTFRRKLDVIALDFQKEAEYKCSLPIKIIDRQEIEDQKEQIADIRYGLDERERRARNLRIFGVKTFSELAREWLDNIKRNYSVSYYQRAKRSIQLFNEYLDRSFLKDKPICDLSVRNIQDFFGDFPGQSVATIRGHKRILHAIFNEAIRYEWLSRNPVDLTRVGASNIPNLRAIEEKDIFSIKEARRFIDILNGFDSSRRNQKAIFKTLIFTGLRSSEMAGLRWEDIDFENKIVKVRRNRLYSTETGAYEKEPKTKNSIRNIPMPQELYDELKDYYEWFKQNNEDFEDNLNKYYLACTMEFEPIFAKNISLYLRYIEKRYGLKKVTPHGIRHTYCSILLANNVPIQTVSKYMGHGDSSITLRVYSHFIPESMDLVVSAMDRAFGSTDSKAGQ